VRDGETTTEGEGGGGRGRRTCASPACARAQLARRLAEVAWHPARGLCAAAGMAPTTRTFSGRRARRAGRRAVARVRDQDGETHKKLDVILEVLGRRLVVREQESGERCETKRRQLAPRRDLPSRLAPSLDPRRSPTRTSPPPTRTHSPNRPGPAAPCEDRSSSSSPRPPHPPPRVHRHHSPRVQQQHHQHHQGTPTARRAARQPPQRDPSLLHL